MYGRPGAMDAAAGVGPSVQRFDDHFTHERGDVLASTWTTFLVQQSRQHAGRR